MIEEDYLSVDVVRLLVERGFDLSEFHGDWYTDYGNTEWMNEVSEEDKEKGTIIINQYQYPLIPLQIAIKWLRKKGLHIFVPLEIDYDEDERGDKWYHKATYFPEIRRVSDGKIMYDDGSLYAEPEQAYEVAIKYCLENLI